MLLRFRDWIRARISRVAQSGDDKRRRLFIALSLLIYVPVIAVFGLLKFPKGSIIEGVLILLVAFVMLGTLILIITRKKITLFYRTSLLLLLGLLGYEVYIGGGSGYAYSWMYLFPVSVFYLFGVREGFVWLGASLLLTAVCFTMGVAEYDPALITRFYTSYCIVSLFSYGIESSRHYYFSKVSEEKQALEETLRQVRTLHGLLPICVSCKKIRDDKGYWNQLEVYIRDHSGADFSHSICPECFPKLYPDLVDKRQTETSDFS